jgi:DNA polymerase IV
VRTALRAVAPYGPVTRSSGAGTRQNAPARPLHADDAVQLALPLAGTAPRELDGAADGIRERFGSSALTRGVSLGRDEGLPLPLPPDG